MRIVTVAALAAGLLTAGAVQAQDIYLGTVRVDEGVVWLDRCDLGTNRYILRDAGPDKPVAALKARLAALKGPVYAEVIGEYAEQGEDNALDVSDIQNIEAEKSCHLLDMVAPPDGSEALFQAAPEIPAPSAAGFGDSLTAAVGDSLVPPRDYAKGPERPDPADYDPNTAGIIYDVAYGGATDDTMTFVVQGYSGDDFVNPAVAQRSEFPLDAKEVNVRDLAIRIEKADAESITYRVRIEPEETPSAPHCPQDCQPSSAGEAGR
jgi:hypothetical protein